jgi:hypothetical protein
VTSTRRLIRALLPSRRSAGDPTGMSGLMIAFTQQSGEGSLVQQCHFTVNR